MQKFLFFLFCTSILFAQEPILTPRQIQAELDEANARFARAKKMFNPWYTGPLITPSPGMMPPGQANIQPYLFINGTYGAYNKKRKAKPIPHNVYTLQVTSGIATGITKTVDCSITPAGQVSWANRRHGGGFSDLSATIGFLINPESLYIPGMKFSITETFPTGKYQHLSLNGLGLNSTGGGTYQTQFGFAISKLFWWWYEHPMNLRFFVGYTVETPVHVEGFNTYGGGLDTHGVVHPGDTLTTDLGIEYSFTERWVIACDIAYIASGRTKFNGFSAAPVGNPYNDNLSLAPAIEYNWDENLGILWGVQFSVYGRSSPVFAKGQFSVTYTW